MASESPSALDLQMALVEEDPQIAAALARVERGTFGLCERCERPIERARIEADPLVATCACCGAGARVGTRHVGYDA